MSNTKRPRRILPQRGKPPDFVTGEEGLAMATHNLRRAKSGICVRELVEVHIVANRVANGKS
jgi:hypothetical protein